MSRVLAAAVLASAMAFLDVTALNVALPALQADLGASGAELLWIVNAYALVLTALLLIGGSLGDRYGRRRILATGIATFSAASLACGLAPSTGFLIAARAVQGAAAALTIPGSLALLTAATSEDRRGRAIGAWSAWSVVATALGPVLGGLLAGEGWWRAVFFLNLPLAIAALAVLRGVPESRDEAAPESLDLPGALLAAAGLSGITAGCLLAPERTAGDPRVLAALGIGMAALVLFAIVEARTAHPLLPLSLFRSRSLSVGVVLTLLVHSAFHGLLLFLPLHLIQAQGYGASAAGLTQLPGMLLLIALSRWAGGLVDRHGPRLPLTWGPGIAALGFLLLSRPGLTAGPSYFWTVYLPPLLAIGVGMALTLSPLSATVLSSLPTGRSGLASGINSTASRLAGVLAVAILGAVALSTFGQALELRARGLDLPDSAREALAAQATKFGAAQAPEGMPQARQAIREALTDTFRHICRLAALLCGAGALLAAGALPSAKLRDHRHADPGAHHGREEQRPD